MQSFLLIAAFVFIAWDVFMGFRRGFFSALLRFGFIGVCFAVAYFASAPLSGILMELPLPFLGGQTLHAAYEGYLGAQAGLSDALALSEAVEQLVLHLPDVLLSEIDFIVLFVLLRLLTLPLSFFVSRLLFGKPQKKRSKKAQSKGTAEGNAEKKEKKSLAGTLRGAGMAVGFLQAVVCFAVVLVPIFGIVEFGERFHASFADSEETVLAEISVDIKEGLVDPINASPVTAISEAVGLRSACVSVFHNLSDTTLVLSNGERQIDYFEYLESMFPAVSALLKLSDIDPEHMTTKDYENLSVVLQTAQNNEDIAQAVQDSVTGVVSEFVEESYRASADVVINVFADKVVNNKQTVSAEQLEHEVKAIEKTMQVIQTATSESAESAFEAVSAEELVNDIIKTEHLYDTLIEVSNDPEQRDVLVKDFTSTEEQKAEMKAELDKYRAESVQARTPEEAARILEMTDAIANLLDLSLDEISADLLP